MIIIIEFERWKGSIKRPYIRTKMAKNLYQKYFKTSKKDTG